VVTRVAEFKRAGRAATAFAGLALLSGCAVLHGKQDTPAWYQQRVEQLKKEHYPQLASVPQPTPSTRSDASWSQVQSAVEGAGAALEANPRAAPAKDAPAAAGAFEAAARRDAESQRPER
jgi:hypothetical protein